MGEGYAKLYASIVHSTVWREPDHVRIVWVTMLALSDADGYVGASLPGLADAARVPIGMCTEAIARLSAPDPYSRCRDHDGRRIAEVDRGWRILTYASHRQRDLAERERERKRAWWRDHKSPSPTIPGTSDPLDAASETRRMQRQRQRQRQSPPPIPTPNTEPRAGARATPHDGTPRKQTAHDRVLSAYRAAYVTVYGREPVITAGDRSQVGRLLSADRPADCAPDAWPAELAAIAAEYVRLADEFAADAGHPLRLLPTQIARLRGRVRLERPRASCTVCGQSTVPGTSRCAAHPQGAAP
jgi:hypothetical protein